MMIESKIQYWISITDELYDVIIMKTIRWCWYPACDNFDNLHDDIDNLHDDISNGSIF